MVNAKLNLTFSMIVWLLCSVIFMAASQTPNSDVKDIGIKGGSLGVQTDNYYVAVIIPEGAILENTTVTLTVKPATKWGPFGKNVITGISLKPSGLHFYEPVEVTTCNYLYDISDNDEIFWLKTNMLAIPCIDHSVSTDENVVTGTTYLSGNFVVASPTINEVLQQAKRLMDFYGSTEEQLPASVTQKNKGPNPDIEYPEEGDCMGWQEVIKVVRGMIRYCERANMAGKTYESGLWRQYIDEFMRKAVDNFLKKPIPEDPCGLYLWAAQAYAELEISTGVNVGPDPSALQERLASILDRCMFRFTLETRVWINRKERWDDGGTVDEHMNRHGTYYFNVPFYKTSQKVDDLEVQGSGEETIEYEKKVTVGDKERNESKSGVRKVTDVKGSLYLTSSDVGLHKIEATVSLYFQHNIKSKSWGVGYGSTGKYDLSSVDNAKSKETKTFLVDNYESKIGDDNAGWSMKVVLLQEPSGKDKPTECW